MTEYAIVSNNSRYEEKVVHTVRRTIILTEYAEDGGPFTTLDNRMDIERILGMVNIRVREIHNSVITYRL